MKRFLRHRLYQSICAVGLVGVTATVHGAGLEIAQRGIKEMTTGISSSAAIVEDASAVGNNPAGLMRLEGRNILVGAQVLLPEFEYDTEVRRNLRNFEEGDNVSPTVSGESTGEIDGVAVAPHLYYGERLSDNAAWGIGIYAPFGSATEYDEDWAGRYHATETEITVVNINPTFAFQATENLSVGFGAIIQYMEGRFDNPIDVGWVVANELFGELEEEGIDTEPEGRETIDDELSENFDVFNNIEVDGWTFGLNFGLLFEPSENTRLGLNYQSRTRHNLTGEAVRPETEDPEFEARLADAIEESIRANADAIENIFGSGQIRESAEEGAAKAVGPLGAAGGDVNSRVNLPQIITASFYQRIFDTSFALTGGVTWTEWSDLEEVRFEYTDESLRGGEDFTGEGDDVRRRDLVQPFDWEDTFRYGLGLIYDGFQNVTLRAGAAYDESPIPDESRRTPRGPDSDRIIAGLGLGWTPTRNIEIDVGYTYTMFRESDINNEENPAGSEHRIVGKYQGQLHTLGAQVGYRF